MQACLTGHDINAAQVAKFHSGKPWPADRATPRFIGEIDDRPGYRAGEKRTISSCVTTSRTAPVILRLWSKVSIREPFLFVTWRATFPVGRDPVGAQTPTVALSPVKRARTAAKRAGRHIYDAPAEEMFALARRGRSLPPRLNRDTVVVGRCNYHYVPWSENRRTRTRTSVYVCRAGTRKPLITRDFVLAVGRLSPDSSPTGQ